LNHEKRIQEKKAPCRYEFRGVKKDGSVGYFEVVAEVLKDDGKIVGTCSYIWEITERKQAEEAIKQHQSDLKRLSIKLVSSLEAERKRISQELHDEVGQALTAVKINLSVISPMLQSGAAPRVRERLAETIDLTEDLLEKIQDLSLSLRPSMLDDLGLVPALRWYIDSFEKRTKIKTRLQILNVKERFRPEIETSLFRIVQEALTNAVKYAKADLITIYLKKKKSEIELSIVDNGEGFDLEEFRSRPFSDRGIGLIGIQERAASHNGAAQIHTQTNQGTQIIISIPREVRAWTP
jgi:two-component system sensor histidine kinase UhpB